MIREHQNYDHFYESLEQGILTVVDVFSEWAGPCNAMQNYLKKIKLEVKLTTMSIAMKMSQDG